MISNSRQLDHSSKCYIFVIYFKTANSRKWHFKILGVFVCLFWAKVLVYILRWPRTLYIVQNDFKLTAILLPLHPKCWLTGMHYSAQLPTFFLHFALSACFHINTTQGYANTIYNIALCAYSMVQHKWITQLLLSIGIIKNLILLEHVTLNNDVWLYSII